MFKRPFVHFAGTSVACFPEGGIIMEHEEILRRIREEREDHDESQRDIAAALNMTQSQYQKYEAGKTVLSLRCLIGICNHYKVSADYLLGLPKNYRKPRRL